MSALAGWLVSDAAGMVTGASYTMDGGVIDIAVKDTQSEAPVSSIH